MMRKEVDGEEESESEEKKAEESSYDDEEEGEDELSDESVASDVQRIERMAMEMDNDIVKRKEYQLSHDKKNERRDNKRKKIIEQ